MCRGGSDVGVMYEELGKSESKRRKGWPGDDVYVVCLWVRQNGRRGAAVLPHRRSHHSLLRDQLVTWWHKAIDEHAPASNSKFGGAMAMIWPDSNQDRPVGLWLSS